LPKKKIVVDKTLKINILQTMKRIFKIPVSWTSIGTMEVSASSLEEAIAIAEDDLTGLPKDSEYLDGSFEVNIDLINGVKAAVGEENLANNAILNI
jgi:hypothetical protein